MRTASASVRRTVRAGAAMLVACVATLAVIPALSVAGAAAQPIPLPPPWETVDIGAPARGGNATWLAGSFLVNGVGASIGGSSDQFAFVYQPLEGDGEVVARVSHFDGQSNGAQAGVMLRSGLAPDAAFAAVLLAAGSRPTLEWRPAAGGRTTLRAGSQPAHRWLRLARRGTEIQAFSSADGSRWQSIGNEIVAQAGPIYVGLAVASGSRDKLAAATFTSVEVTRGARERPARAPNALPSAAPAKGSGNHPPTISVARPASGASFAAPAAVEIAAVAADRDGAVTLVEFFAGSVSIGSVAATPYTITWQDPAPGIYTISAKAWDDSGASMISAGVNITVVPPAALPPGWQTVDIGGPISPGSARYEAGTFSIYGAGEDISERSDQFRFVYQATTGDGDWSACIAALDYVDSWTKAGIMVREALTPGSRHAFSLLSAGWGVAFHHRLDIGGPTGQAGVAPGLAPHCVRLVRRGDLFSAFQSVDGTTWIPMGTQTIVMNPTVYVGLAVTSRLPSRPARGIFNKVSIQTREHRAAMGRATRSRQAMVRTDGGERI